MTGSESIRRDIRALGRPFTADDFTPLYPNARSDINRMLALGELRKVGTQRSDRKGTLNVYQYVTHNRPLTERVSFNGWEKVWPELFVVPQFNNAQRRVVCHS